MKRKVSPWTLTYVGVFQFILRILILIVQYFINGTFNIGALIGSFIATVILVLANIIYIRQKKDNTPIIDTRVRNNMLKYIAFASQVIFLLFMVSLTIATFSGMETIPTIYLWIAVGINMAVIGIGALVVQFR